MGQSPFIIIFRMSQQVDFDVNVGYFRNNRYSVKFEFYGHASDDRGVSVLSKMAAYELGFSAISILDSHGVKTEGASEWKVEDPTTLLCFMKALETSQVQMQNRIILLLSATVKDQNLAIRIWLSQTPETLAMIDDHITMITLHRGKFILTE